MADSCKRRMEHAMGHSLALPLVGMIIPLTIAFGRTNERYGYVGALDRGLKQQLCFTECSHSRLCS